MTHSLPNFVSEPPISICMFLIIHNCTDIAKLLAQQWRKARPRAELEPRIFSISSVGTSESSAEVDAVTKSSAAVESGAAVESVAAVESGAAANDTVEGSSGSSDSSDAESSDSDDESDASDNDDVMEDSGTRNTFVEYYDQIQYNLEVLSGMDEFLSGMYH